MKHGRSDYNGRIVDLENKIPEDEPVFLLRGQDKLAPQLLLKWATELRLGGGDPNMAREAENHAQLMIEWQKTNKVKTPDQYNDSPEKQFILNKIKTIISDVESGKYTKPSELTTWLIKYFGDIDDLVTILMPHDVKESSRDKSVDELEFDDFKTTDEGTLGMMKSKVILYYSSTKMRILKSSI